MRPSSVLRGLFLFLFILGLAPSSAHSARYSYDEEQSKVIFTIRHLGILTVSGEFRDFSGTFQFDPERVQDSTVDIAIKTASVESKNKRRDNTLRSEKFFWSEKHPEILFKSRTIQNISGFIFDIEGDLTIRGVTRPAVFHTVFYPANLGGEAIVADGGRERPFFRAETVIRRRDYRLGTSGGFDPFLAITNEELRITLEVEGVPK